MRSKSSMALLVLATATTSALVGFATANVISHERSPSAEGQTSEIDYAQQFLDAEMGHAGLNVHVARALRSGRCEDALSLVEAALATNVIILDEIKTVRSTDAERIDRLLRKAAQYWDQFQVQLPDEEVNERITTVLPPIR